MKPSYKRPYYYLHNVNVNAEVPTNPYEPITGEGTDMCANPYGVSPAGSTSDYIYHIATSFDENETYYTLNLDGSGYTLISGTPTEADFNERTVAWYTRLSTEIEDTLITGQTGVFNLPRTQRLNTNSVVSLVEKPTGQRLANASRVRVEIRTGKDDSIFELKSIYIDYIKAPQYIRLTQEQIDLTEDTSQMMEFPDYVCQEIINELTHLIMENSSDPRLQSHMPVTMSIANPAQG